MCTRARKTFTRLTDTHASFLSMCRPIRALEIFAAVAIFIALIVYFVDTYVNNIHSVVTRQLQSSGGVWPVCRCMFVG